MQNPRLAGRYAKSLIDISVEQQKLEEVFAEVQYLATAVRSSRELKTLLRSPIVKADKKLAVLNAINKDKVGPITNAFTRLLVTKGRENVLPEILEAFIDQYNKLKGIHQVKLTTALPLSDSIREAILAKINNEAGITRVELETVVNEDLIGGFVLEYDNNLVDASIQRDLRDIRKQFNNNDYIYNIR